MAESRHFDETLHNRHSSHCPEKNFRHHSETCDSDWVVLPVASFDAYYGNTNFSRKYLSKIPEEIMERSEQQLGVSRFRIKQ